MQKLSDPINILPASPGCAIFSNKSAENTSPIFSVSSLRSPFYQITKKKNPEQ